MPVRVVVQRIVESKESFVSAELQDVVKIWAMAKVLKEPFHESITVGSYWHGTPVFVFVCGGTTGFTTLTQFSLHALFH